MKAIIFEVITLTYKQFTDFPTAQIISWAPFFHRGFDPFSPEPLQTADPQPRSQVHISRLLNINGPTISKLSPDS